MSPEIFDVVVVGGGPIGLSAAYEVAKAGRKVLVLEQNNFFNQAGSSNDLARMFRTMYTESFMADLAKESLGLWDALEKDAGTSLRLMSGLLNFGDGDYGGDTPEGTLLGPIPNLKRLNMAYEELTKEEIEDRYPFRDLPSTWVGLFAPDNGVINVPLLLRTLLNLAKAYGAVAKQHTCVTKIDPPRPDGNSTAWKINTSQDGQDNTYEANKIIIASGSYVNHVLQPSFGISLDLDIWEMAACYFNTNPGPNGTIFPSMWFQFAPDDEEDNSKLFYGFPTLPWGPPNVARIAVDAAKRRILDPNDRQGSSVSSEDIRNVQDFVRDHIPGVDATVPASMLSCLQTNVFDNMFVLDFIPKEHLRGGPQDSVMVFTAGWAMKFVPLLGKALAEMALEGKSQYALKEFAITRKDPKTGKGIILKDGQQSSFAFATQASGSSIRGLHNTGR
ncbi:hypothetical protein M426DRAFT_68352 [Hypoxylon sp. CI-4A]|nr:hypothetical protein M426DRAFT_68352 [Hypoxylon sp. CI-4A]